MAEVALRALGEADMDAVFAQMRDPESVRMAAFTADDPDDRVAFDAQRARIAVWPGVQERAITLDGVFVGTIATFVQDGETELTYWVDRAFWGRDIAGRAVKLMLDEVRTRPIVARAAADNAGSLRVLAKNGFVVVGTETGFAIARREEIEECVLRLE
ncbi:GNAT family N-acetyltransferase [Actinoplanes sp. NPDC051470]|uniref:GNAT family N-acetyltransferase n=1 Tax=Actinoplanes sp. NPDC051470 TaxID=3157224 RepID=UPI00343B85D9